jgi:uncharacterized protein with HEPN domain
MKEDRIYLDHILHNIAAVQRLVKKGKTAFLEDEDAQAAVMYYLQTLSESTTHLSDDIKASQPEIPWRRIRNFRNVVVHNYLSIDLEIVWGIIVNDLPSLAAAVEAMLAALGDEAQNSE